MVVKSTRDSIGRIEIVKMAQGKDYQDSRDRASNINYGTSFTGNKLILDSYLTSEMRNNFRDQNVRVTLFLPVGSTLFADENISSFHRSSDYFGNILQYNSEGNFLRITENGYNCETCEGEESNSDSWEEDSWDEDEENTESDSLFEIKKDSITIRIDEKGVRVSNTKPEKIRNNQG